MTTLDEIEKRLEAAADGPWEFISNRVGSHDVIYAANGDCVGQTAQAEDATFIAHAPTDIAHLLRIARAAEKACYAPSGGPSEAALCELLKALEASNDQDA